MLYQKTSPKQTAWLVYIAVTLSQLSIGLYLPALPAMTRALATTSQTMQMTLTTYLIGFGISQLLYGPMSDRFGRRNVFLLSLSLVFLGSLGCYVADSATMLLISRFVQGLGTGACVVLSFAILRDLFSGNEYAQCVSLISLFSGIATVTAPFFGGMIMQFLGWREEFGFLLVYSGVIGIAFLLFFPETKTDLQLDALRWRNLTHSYGMLLKHRLMLSLLIAVGLLFGAVLLINAMLPFLFEDILKIPPATFGTMTLFNGLGFMAGTLIANRTVKKVGFQRLQVYGLIGVIVFAVATLLPGLFGILSWPVVLTPIVLLMVATGVAYPNICAGVMQPFPDKVGFASALLGFFLALMSVVATVSAGYLHEHNQIPLAIALLVLGGLSLLLVLVGKRSARSPA